MRFRFRSLASLIAVLIVTGTLGRIDAAQPAQESAAVSSAGAADAAPLPAAIEIPGPLRSFLRMDGISQEVRPEEVLPLLARNAFLYGYQTGHKTEYLVLADRYVHMARELQPLAGPDGKIHVAGCDDAGTLIKVLGYQFEHGCSRQDASVVTADAERAFITVDSGFPLSKLEQSLQEGAPFVYSYASTRVPILFSEKDWMAV